MAPARQAWLRVDHVPGFRSPDDAFVWCTRVYLANVLIGREPPSLLDHSLVGLFSMDARDAFKQVMHELVGFSGRSLTVPGYDDYAPAEHEAVLLSAINSHDSTTRQSSHNLSELAGLLGYGHAIALVEALAALNEAFQSFRPTAAMSAMLWPVQATFEDRGTSTIRRSADRPH